MVVTAVMMNFDKKEEKVICNCPINEIGGFLQAIREDET
jgi:hypothetical protein